MTHFKKAVSLILVLAISFSLALPAKAEQTATVKGPNDYAEMLWNEGYSPISADLIVGVLQHIGKILSIFTGQESEMKNFDLTLDRFTSDLFGYIFENSGFDLEKILTNLPDISIPAKIAVETFKIDTTAFREEMYLMKARCDENGDGTMAVIFHFLGLYLSIIEQCEIYGEKTEDADVYELAVRLTFEDETTEVIKPGILVNTKTGECTNRDDSGMLGIGFNYSLSEMMLYATVNCWMRDFGFCLLYDVAANLIPVVYRYETRRFKFDYDGLQWMIQIWKGNYFVANGSEVGLYCRTPQKFGSFYECAKDEQMLPMTMELYHGDTLLMEKPQEKHWWINGFNMSGIMYLPMSLTMKFSIVMPDEEMLSAFCESIDNQYRHDVSYTVEGLKVNVVW